jgi:hypothetical protein
MLKTMSFGTHILPSSSLEKDLNTSPSSIPPTTPWEKKVDHMEGEGIKCVKKVYIPTLKTESEELSSHTLHPPKGHNT